MTPEQWSACTKPESMLRFLLGTDAPRIVDVEAFPDQRGSDRKLRLFACACYERVSHLLPDPLARLAVQTAEGFADGVVIKEELHWVEKMVRKSLDALEGRWRASQGAEHAALLPTHAALALAYQIVTPQAPKAAYYAASNASWTLAAIANPGKGLSDGKFSTCESAAMRAQAIMLRCIFGSTPFSHPSVRECRQESNVLALAQRTYGERNFTSALPVLADALEKVGCGDQAILAHLRRGGPHVRGCWALDAVLGWS